MALQHNHLRTACFVARSWVGEAPEQVPAMIAAADTQQNGVITFGEFVPMVRGQLGAVSPTTGWGHQSEADVLAQLLDDPASRAKYEQHLPCNTSACDAEYTPRLR